MRTKNMGFELFWLIRLSLQYFYIFFMKPDTAWGAGAGKRRGHFGVYNARGLN